MDFMQAVKEMEDGNLTRMTKIKKFETLIYRLKDDVLEFLSSEGQWFKSQTQGHVLTRAEWSLFEEPKKTLSDKVNPKSINSNVYAECDVREAVKEFMDIFKEDNTFAYYKAKAEKIFGEELLK